MYNTLMLLVAYMKFRSSIVNNHQINQAFSMDRFTNQQICHILEAFTGHVITHLYPLEFHTYTVGVYQHCL